MKYSHSKINLVLSAIMISVFVFLTGINFIFYSKLMKEDAENISKLTSSNIYSEIQNEIVKPIVVSLTMANDSFIIDWTRNELNKQEHINKYLNGIKEKYDYDTAFFVSASTGIYYTENGVFKTVNNTIDLDSWYYDFIASPELYELNVDADEDENFDLTVFVNCKVLNDKDELLGVIGVGLKMTKIQKLLSEFQETYNTIPYIIDSKGTVQAHAEGALIEKNNVFNNGYLADYKDSILVGKNDFEIFYCNGITEEKLIISKYMRELDWYLLVEKDTIVRKSLYRNILNNFLTVTLAYFLLILVMNYVVNAYERKLIDIANTDHLTHVPNRRKFDESLREVYNSAKVKDKPFSLVIFDIDDFKKINDTHGHVFADEILITIANKTEVYFEHYDDYLFRIGGDEFALLLFGTNEENLTNINGFIKMLEEIDTMKKCHVTISIGITHYTKDIIDPMQMMRKADLAMYEAKIKGKNTHTIFSDSENKV